MKPFSVSCVTSYYYALLHILKVVNIFNFYILKELVKI